MATVKIATMTMMEMDVLPQLAQLQEARARCTDCDEDTMPLKANGRPNFKAWDIYVASDGAWIEAGMAKKRWGEKRRWGTGFLCLGCLRRRLRRDPVPGTDLLVWTISRSAKGLKQAFTKQYADRVRRGRGY